MKRILSIMLILSLILTISACGDKVEIDNNEGLDKQVEEGQNKANEEEKTNLDQEKEEKGLGQGEGEPANSSQIRVGVLKGPTGFGMSRLMDQVDKDQVALDVKVEVYPTPDKLIPMVVQGEVDFACLPTNMASSLYNKTDGKLVLCGVNTLSVLHLVGKSDLAEKIRSLADLKGYDISSTGKGAVPEYLINHLVEKNGLELAKDLNIDYSFTHQELANMVAAGQVDLAILPQPFATIATVKGKDIDYILDLNDEWAKIYDDLSITTGCIVVSRDFLEKNPKLTDEFLLAYKDSINWVNSNPEEASKIIEDQGLFPQAKIAQMAIPKCNMVYMDGEEARKSVEAFLTILFEANPKSVGGRLPEEDFYK